MKKKFESWMKKNNKKLFSEMEITDPILEEKIREFARLSDQIDKIKSELTDLQNRYGEIEGELRDVLDALEETKDKSLKIKGILVTIKRAGYERETVQYKAAFDWLNERVNPTMQEIVRKSMEANKKITRIASSIGVQKTESFSSMLQIIKSYLEGLKNRIKFQNKELDSFITEFS